MRPHIFLSKKNVSHDFIQGFTLEDHKMDCLPISITNTSESINHVSDKSEKSCRNNKFDERSKATRFSSSGTWHKNTLLILFAYRPLKLF